MTKLKREIKDIANVLVCVFHPSEERRRTLIAVRGAIRDSQTEYKLRQWRERYIDNPSGGYAVDKRGRDAASWEPPKPWEPPK